MESVGVNSTNREQLKPFVKGGAAGAIAFGALLAGTILANRFIPTKFTSKAVALITSPGGGAASLAALVACGGLGGLWFAPRPAERASTTPAADPAEAEHRQAVEEFSRLSRGLTLGQCLHLEHAASLLTGNAGEDRLNQALTRYLGSDKRWPIEVVREVLQEMNSDVEPSGDDQLFSLDLLFSLWLSREEIRELGNIRNNAPLQQKVRELGFTDHAINMVGESWGRFIKGKGGEVHRALRDFADELTDSDDDDAFDVGKKPLRAPQWTAEQEGQVVALTKTIDEISVDPNCATLRAMLVHARDFFSLNTLNHYIKQHQFTMPSLTRDQIDEAVRRASGGAGNSSTALKRVMAQFGLLSAEELEGVDRGEIDEQLLIERGLTKAGVDALRAR